MTSIYIVQYNDCYGNGTDKSFEVALTDKKDFKAWLKEHNAERKGMGAMKESADEFDIIELKVFETQLKK